MEEWFNRILEEHLQKIVSEHEKDWDEHIPIFLLAYRPFVHDSTPRSLANVTLGYEVKLPGGLKFGVKPVLVGDATYPGKEKSLNEFHELVRTRIKMVTDRMKARYDRTANK